MEAHILRTDADQKKGMSPKNVDVEGGADNKEIARLEIRQHGYRLVAQVLKKLVFFHAQFAIVTY